MGHLGPEKVIDLAQKRFYWPKMGDDIKNFIQKRCRCLIDKHPNVKECAELCPVEATYPFEMVSIDFVQLERCKGGYTYVLIVIDHFTRFVQFYGTRSKSSKAAADVLFNQFILNFGFPVRILHDRGGEFNGRLFAELHRLAGIKAVNTTPYNPQGNGACERYNRVLVSMLRALSSKEKADWRKHLPKLAFAVNATRNKSTGFSSFFLMFGREAKLPIDQIFQEIWDKRSDAVTHEQFAENWHNSMDQAYNIARENIGKAKGYNKRWYDRKAKSVEIKTNDLVLVKNDRERLTKKKLRSYWERNLFRVVEVRKDLPVFKVKNIHKTKDIRILHRNKLMLVNEIPFDLFEKPESKISTASKKIKQNVREDLPLQSETDSEDADVVVMKESFPVESDSNSSSHSSMIEGVEEIAGFDDKSMGSEEEQNWEILDEVAEEDGNFEGEKRTRRVQRKLLKARKWDLNLLKKGSWRSCRMI